MVYEKLLLRVLATQKMILTELSMVKENLSFGNEIAAITRDMKFLRTKGGIKK